MAGTRIHPHKNVVLGSRSRRRLNVLRIGNCEGLGRGSSLGPSKHVNGKITTIRAAGGYFSVQPSSRRNVSKKEFPLDKKLADLRKEFEKNADYKGLDAYIVPSEDPHQSEFIADCYMRRAYISGFTGSAGTAVITKEKAALWTDGRYFLQAENELGHEWTLMRAGQPYTPSTSEWLKETLPEGARVGIDPFLFSADAGEELRRVLAEKDQELVLVYEDNLVDKVWGDARPAPPSEPLRVHELRYAGVDVATKLTNLRKELVNAGASAIIITMLDEVAWLLNVRGNDVPHSPVAYAYVVVGLETASLFVDESKVTPEVLAHLNEAGVTVKPYASLVSEIKGLASKGSKLWLDSSRVSVAIKNAFDDACAQYYEDLEIARSKRSSKGKTAFDEELNGPAALHRPSPVGIAKAIKNDAELEGMRQAHLRDAAALCEFWAWLESKIVDEKQQISEVEVADHLEKFRAKQAGFLDTSFETISGSGPNGAIVHYRAEAATCRYVDDKQLYLLDSGAQFVDGTTDITRTVHFGTPSARQKECFTRVLQGHIGVDTAVFPEHTPGFVLDAFARSSLWKIGLDYRHGTGHGVGAALNVHEGPQSVSARFGNMTGLEQGMIVSNEPGYYEDRAFGIRIENLLIVREQMTANNYGGVTFLGFERLTFVPIQTKLLDLEIMSDQEIKWLNDYHAEVFRKVSPLVKGNARRWLEENTRPIGKTGKSSKPEELITASK